MISPLAMEERKTEPDYTEKVAFNNMPSTLPTHNGYKIDHSKSRYPHCIVWTPIPCLTWLFPFIGHMGIATSIGVIRDFAGPYYVSGILQSLYFHRYWQLDLSKSQKGKEGWDRAVSEASEVYKHRMHNLCCDNCHSHVATALNLMNYDGSSSYNMVKLAFYMLIYGKYVRSLAKMSSVSTIETPQTCDSLVGLVKRQKKICKKNLEVMHSVKLGALNAIEECSFQFKNRRWNCSTVEARTIFGNVLKLGTREASFVHAISAAGVAHAVTRACSSGKLTKCGCDRTIRGPSKDGFEWSGCSDNIAYGTAFSKAFVDARDRRRSRNNKNAGRKLMNLHNNEAGRKAIEDNMKVDCKCHGVSGSCELRTCWRAMPRFREVGVIIKEKFDGATEVKLEKTKSIPRLVPVNPTV
ncbi:hypothetical protein FSP39_012347 [Pinctada imbricata]|uniref:Protein Wnt n=1 Tax=Pinctada imbricata TaxID=66713 RepID=A0AA88YNL2_PINIB|nr:hypothetical protein FSP39_012347 [Pinctada imbricata]